MLEWPSRSCTVLRSAPASWARDAAPCRRSWSRTGGRSARSTLGVRSLRDFGEDGPEPAGVEVGQVQPAEGRDEDTVDVAGVVQLGGRADAGSAGAPVPQPPLDR